MKVCTICQQPKNDEEFNFRYKALGIRHNVCIVCQRVYKRKWYHGTAKETHLKNVKERNLRVRDEAREFVYQYLSQHPCSQCGEADPRVLEFHHVEGKEKAVSEMVAGGYPIRTIQAEIDRCVVLCANCHRKLTMDERGWFRGRK